MNAKQPDLSFDAITNRQLDAERRALHLRRLGAVGILKPSDIESLNEASQRVFDLMQDGRWHGPDAIELAAGNGNRMRSGMRRLRELRSVGIRIERRRMKNANRVFEYRIVKR